MRLSLATEVSCVLHHGIDREDRRGTVRSELKIRFNDRGVENMSAFAKSMVLVASFALLTMLANAGELLPPLTYEKLREELGKPLAEQTEATRPIAAKLAKSQVPTEEEARKLALGAFLRHVGVDARERWRVTGLIQIGRDVPEFAKEGDLVWEVRITRLGQDHVSGVIWVSTTTKQARVLFPTVP